MGRWEGGRWEGGRFWGEVEARASIPPDVHPSSHHSSFAQGTWSRFLLRRQRWLQYLTFSQSSSHFFRHSNSRLQTRHVLVGRLLWLTTEESCGRNLRTKPYGRGNGACRSRGASYTLVTGPRLCTVLTAEAPTDRHNRSEEQEQTVKMGRCYAQSFCDQQRPHRCDPFQLGP